MPTILWVPIIGLIGTVLGALVVGVFNYLLKKTPEKKSESEERVTEFNALMAENRELREELKAQVKALQAQNNDQSAQIRILKKENRGQAAQSREAEQREELLLSEMEKLKNQVRALEEERDGRHQ